MTGTGYWTRLNTWLANGKMGEMLFAKILSPPRILCSAFHRMTVVPLLLGVEEEEGVLSFIVNCDP